MGYCPVKLGMMSSRLQSGVNSLQGFREDKRNQISLGKMFCFCMLILARPQGRDPLPRAGARFPEQ